MCAVYVPTAFYPTVYVHVCMCCDEFMCVYGGRGCAVIYVGTYLGVYMYTSIGVYVLCDEPYRWGLIYKTHSGIAAVVSPPVSIQ